jgi:hypothetical protein
MAAAVVKTAPPRPSVEEVSDKADHRTRVSNGSDDEMYTDPAPEMIVIDDDDDAAEVLEAPEESAEAELSTWLFFPA